MLGRIKRPESQAALVELLTAEQDPGMVGSLASALVDLCPTTSRPSRRSARSPATTRYDRTVLHLDEDCSHCRRSPASPCPKPAEWRQRIEQNRSRWAMGMSNVDQAFQPPASLAPSTIHTGPLTPFAAAPRRRRHRSGRTPPPALAARQPFRNAQPKVGRNDPCPCGSGKKYKKCHGK